MAAAVEPIPETREILTALSMTGGRDLLRPMQQQAERVVAEVPGCVGLSVAMMEEGLTFTWLATADRLRSLDAAQYLESGPCEVAAIDGDEVEIADVLDEERWRLMALASAAQGVRSSLSMPLRGPDGPIGSLNLYGGEPRTFTGKERQVASMFGADLEAAVLNADLAMASRRRAEESVQILHERDTIDIAVGILADRHDIPLEEARERLLRAAERADAPVQIVADLVVASQEDVV